MNEFEEDEARRVLDRDETRNDPFNRRDKYGPGSGVAFLIGAVLVIVAIVAYGMWTGGPSPGGRTTTTIEQPATQPSQPPATNPSPG